MKKIIFLIAITLGALTSALAQKAENVYSFEVKTIKGDSQTLDKYKNKVVLIVNTASKCGLTPQYEGLEALYQKYKDQGILKKISEVTHGEREAKGVTTKGRYLVIL